MCLCSKASIIIVQCAKQPAGSKACGLYTCEHLRQCREYTQSWKKLKEGVKYWVNSYKPSFKKVKGEICKFIMEKCVLEGEQFFDEESPLAIEAKYERLRKWMTLLRPSDYKWPVDFS